MGEYGLVREAAVLDISKALNAANGLGPSLAIVA
jgi:hypothetical protein